VPGDNEVLSMRHLRKALNVSTHFNNTIPMKLLPHENLTFRTQLSRKEIFKRLSELTEVEKSFRFGAKKSSKVYEGVVSSDKFIIKKIITYRNSFLPKIEGTIQEDSQSTTIQIRMYLEPFVVTFLIIWCSFAAVGSIALFFQQHDFKFLIPLGMIAFAYLLAFCCFYFESDQCARDLDRILEAEEWT
jgi:hypothetical protein